MLRYLYALGLYPVAALLIPPATLYLAINAAVLAFAIAVVLAFAPSVRGALTSRHLAAGQHLVVGIFMAWLSDALLRAYSGAFRWMDRPDWVIEHPILGHVPGFCLSVGLVGAIVHLTVPNEEGRIPARHLVLIGGAVVAFLAAVAVLVASAF
jgi:hypothetical protein